ncbi:MAG: hypothetical protein KC468_27115 [Myxococcales bacterium]|nr:hypothetical protein [Myxococcales bacterium]
MFVDEHGKEHCCEECATKQKKRLAVGLALGATALATGAFAAGLVLFRRPPSRPRQGEL